MATPRLPCVTRYPCDGAVHDELPGWEALLNWPDLTLRLFWRRSRAGAGGSAAKPYSRLDAEVSAMQRNSSTYCDEPEDRDDYEARPWLPHFPC